nr:unnamed protein product [Digitaria exilis]
MEAIANIISTLPRLLIQKDSYGMRERRLVEYLKQCFPSNISLSTNKELAYALASLPPYQVPFSDVKVVHLHCEVKVRHVKLNILHKVPAGEIWRSLNATVVGLVVSGASEAARSIPYCVGLDFLSIQVRGCVSPYMSTNVLHKISERDLYAADG